MLGKVETPIFILIACYMAILGFAIIFICLTLYSTLNIKNFIKRQEIAMVTRHCKIYLQQNKQKLYESCVKRAIVYYQKENQ